MSLFKPQAVLAHYTQVTPAFLQARGISGLLLDLDNTLVPYKSTAPAPEVEAWLRELQDAGLQVYVLSNASVARAAMWCQRLGVQGVGLAGKPNPAAFRRAVMQMGLQPAQVGMLGDQVFTDILGANLAGLCSLLVHPLSDNALPHTKIARQLEKRVLRRYGLRWLDDQP